MTTIYGGQVTVADNTFTNTSCASTMVVYETDSTVELQNNAFISNTPSEKVIWVQFESKQGIVK
ncbi:hypothetical protein ACP3WZ_27145, partial [Salmonella enterica]|uniref:hypothetical protein n=1 Tax=Salmonella enterica TaxID=28901 RepID=UPI003CF0FB21